jgi:hypothetical protein
LGERMRASIKSTSRAEGLTFRYFPGYLPLGIAFAIFLVYYGLFRVLTVGEEYGWLISPKGIFLLLLGVVGNLLWWSVIVKLWQLHWHFTLTPTHLIATHRLRRKRVEIPWQNVIRVRKLPRAWWARGGGGLGVSQIETVDGQTIPFITHLMMRYRRFIEELKARAVNCREFDPYYSEWE